jgi:predicted nucleic-acid-binding protein
MQEAQNMKSTEQDKKIHIASKGLIELVQK